MQISDLTPERLRRLAELPPCPNGRVLSLYLNLNPSEFATGADKSAAVRSLLDEADRRVRDTSGLDHTAELALRRDLDRVRAFFDGAFSPKGVHGLALFACGPANLFEAIRLPRSVDSGVVINDRPYVQPLSELGVHGRWCVLLVSRRLTRVLRGSADGLREIGRFSDDVHGQHDQGGWSQARYQRSVDEEAYDHLRHTAEVLFRHLKRAPFDRLIIGCTQELCPEAEGRLHPYLRERLAGHVEIDVENSTNDAVAKAVAPLIEREEAAREREALERLQQGLATSGRAAAGLADVLQRLVEQRVSTLLVSPGFAKPGLVCRECGWLGISGERCPVDGSLLERRQDIVDEAMQAAVRQSADVLVLRHHDDLAPHGSIGAVLRW